MKPLLRRPRHTVACATLAVALLGACNARVFTRGEGDGGGGGDGGGPATEVLTLSASNARAALSLGAATSKPGHVFLQLDATLANQSVKNGVVDNPTFFSVELASNLTIALSPSFAALTNACSASVTVNPGASTTCGVAFEIPEDDRPVSLTYRDPAGATASTPIATAIPRSEGDWLLTLSMRLLPERPFVYRVSIARRNDAGALAVDGVPLSEADQSTPVGTAGPLGSATLSADGALLVVFPELTVPGAANPITTGSDVVASEVALDAEPATDPDFICGAVSGQVTSPTTVDLAGSTFTLQRIDVALPAPLLSCGREPASFD